MTVKTCKCGTEIINLAAYCLRRNHRLWIVQDPLFLGDASLRVVDAHRPTHQFALSVVNLDFGGPVVLVVNRGSAASARQVRCRGNLEGRTRGRTATAVFGR